MRKIGKVSTCAAAALAAALMASPTARAQESGAVVGRVVDAATREPLPGALVEVAGSSVTAATGRDGRYRLSSLPAGPASLTVSYLGYASGRADTTVAAGETVQDFALQLTFAESVEVSAGGGLDAQARALNQQRAALNITNVVSADQIGRFPDPNAAEATQRIPGISIQRDQGEGRYVLVRGTEARLNSMMINGERVPSPEGEVRQVALDVIPADLLESIEVSKALLPDMDADAIGGAVNLVTKSAAGEPRLLLNVGSGFNDLAGSWSQLTGGLTLSRRFAGGKAGLLLSGSASSMERASENFEVEYDDGELDTLENRRYDFTRRRYGATAALDYAPGPATQLVLRGLFNYYDDDEVRSRLNNAVGDEELEREVRSRVETQKIGNVSLDGRHFFGRTEAAFHLGFSQAQERNPDSRYSSFLQEDVEFDPNVSPEAIDPDDIQAGPQNQDFSASVLDGLSREVNFTKDRDVVGALDLRYFLDSTGGFSGWLKFGGKLRAKNKERDNEEFEFDVEDDVYLTDVSTTDVGTILDGRYTLGPFVGGGFAAGASAGLESEANPELDAEDFDASEDVAAAYAMASLQLGPKLQFVGGARYEHTSLAYRGYSVEFDEDGDYVGTTPTTGSDGYGQLLPMIHLRYALDARSNLRAAVTRTLARPNYYDLVPYRVVNREDEEILRGNPGLQPTLSWNLDLLGERYFESVGVLSAGLFYKNLSDYIYRFNFEEELQGDEFDVLQPRNGEDATVKGFELAVQRQLDFLPAPLDGLGVYANYTFTDSQASFPGREGEKATLPGQSRHVGNLALSYEKGGFQGRAALNFHGKYIDEVGESAAEDRYYDDHVQLDLSASQSIGSKARVYLELLNLSNEPLRYYRGVPERPDQEEYYRWWVMFGVKLRL